MEEWTPLPMFCNNCGHLNYGFKNKEDKIKYECKKCKLVYVRTIKNRRHQVVELYAPKGESLAI